MMVGNPEHPAVTLLKQKAREYGIPEDEVLGAWEEMKGKHRLPVYVEPCLERRPDGSVVLSPAVNISYLTRLLEVVPDFEHISGPVWPPGRK